MPFKSKKQARYMFWAEKHGKVKPGTAEEWASHTKDISKLPEKVSKAEIEQWSKLTKKVLDPSEGYTFTHQEDTSNKKRRMSTVRAYSPSGEEIGRADLVHKDDHHLHPAMVKVDKEHRRKGIASSMYAHAEKHTNKKVVPSKYQTGDSEALWVANEHHRQFGKSEDYTDTNKSPFAMAVPKGGSCCAKCIYSDNGKCKNPNFIKSETGAKKAGDNRFIDPESGKEMPGDEFCCNFYDWDKSKKDSETDNISKSESLQKTRPTPKFPKLGLGDDRRETPIVTPEQANTKMRHMANNMVSYFGPGDPDKKRFVDAQHQMLKEGDDRVVGRSYHPESRIFVSNKTDSGEDRNPGQTSISYALTQGHPIPLEPSDKEIKQKLHYQGLYEPDIDWKNEGIQQNDITSPDEWNKYYNETKNKFKKENYKNSRRDSGDSSFRPNSIKIHEDLHNIFNRVQEKYGREGRQNLTYNLYHSIPSQYHWLMDALYANNPTITGDIKGDKDPYLHEEKLARLVDSLNGEPRARSAAYRLRPGSFDSVHHHRAYQHLLNAANVAHEGWVRRKMYDDNGKFLQKSEEYPELEELEKNWKGSILGATVGLAGLANQFKPSIPSRPDNAPISDSGAYNAPLRPRTPPKVALIEHKDIPQPKVHPSDLFEGLDPDLHPISFLESSYGKNINHAKNSKGEFETAFGHLGFKPETAYEIYNHSKDLKTKYPNLGDKTKFLDSFKTNPRMYNAIASHQWQHLKSKLGSPERAALGWRYGLGAALKHTADQIDKEGYVKKYKALYEKGGLHKAVDFPTYYKPENPHPIEVMRNWRDKNMKPKEHIHIIPIEQVWPHREYEWNAQNHRSGAVPMPPNEDGDTPGWVEYVGTDKGKLGSLSPQEVQRLNNSGRNIGKGSRWDALKEYMSKYGWKKDDPAHIYIGKDGGIKVGEGNHRLAVAKELGVTHIPVMFHAQDTVHRVNYNDFPHLKPINAAPDILKAELLFKSEQIQGVQTRKNSKGELEYLLYRGMDKNELNEAVHGDVVNHQKYHTSWAIDPKLASQYAQSHHGQIVAAWVNKKFIDKVKEGGTQVVVHPNHYSPLESVSMPMGKSEELGETHPGPKFPKLGLGDDRRETPEPLEKMAQLTYTTPEFQRWFEGSHVKTPDGKPLRVYHGTSKDEDFNAFRIGHRGAFFTESPESASEYARDNDSQKTVPDIVNGRVQYNKVNVNQPRVIPVHLSIKNPYIPNQEDINKLRYSANYTATQRQIFDAAKAKGHDGVNMGEGTWVAFYPEQVKSIFNNIPTEHKSIIKNEILEKGAMRRLAPFNPKTTHRNEVEQKYLNAKIRTSEDREKIPLLHPNGLKRALHKLSTLTPTRLNDKGEREYLLHRGTRSDSADDLVNKRSSWTPRYRTALEYAEGSTRNRENTRAYMTSESRKNGQSFEDWREAQGMSPTVLSGWINEKHILHYFPQVIGQVGPNKYNPNLNFEVIVAPHKINFASQNNLNKINKSEILEKGAMKRIAPYNPNTHINDNERHNIFNWQQDQTKKHRDAIPSMHENAKIRALHKLSKLTKVRMNDNREREFLLHRGAHPSEPTNPDSRTSWTTRFDVAKIHAGKVQQENPRSAWINEKHIISYLPQVYHLDPTTNRSYDYENEVIVAPNHMSSTASDQDLVHLHPSPTVANSNTLDRRINFAAQKHDIEDRPGLYNKKPVEIFQKLNEKRIVHPLSFIPGFNKSENFTDSLNNWISYRISQDKELSPSPDHVEATPDNQDQPTLNQILEIARFLSQKHPATQETINEALNEHEDDPYSAALYAYELPQTPENKAAIIALLAHKMQKSEDGIVPAPKEITSPCPDAEDVVQSLKRAFAGNLAEHVDLHGKHSKKSLVALDPKTDRAYILKPNDHKFSPAKGVADTSASQPVREAVFYHIAVKYDLLPYFPRAELILLDGKDWAAIKKLPAEFKTMGLLKHQNKNLPAKLLKPYLEKGIAHKWAIIDYVLGQTDRHSGNLLTDPETGQVVLIDQGSALAGKHFDPANDPKSYIPFYLRAFSGKNFFKLTPEEKLANLPTISPEIDQEIRKWLSGLEESVIETVCREYKVDPRPYIERLEKLKRTRGSVALMVNKYWAE